MKCPIDATDLLIADRSGIEIDYCPQCRGVWLDRGELDKIIERSTGFTEPAPPANNGYAPPMPTYDRGQNRGNGHHGSREGHHGGRRRFGDLFDF
ncbi:hypothetical protein JCM13591A_20920 [Microbacterium xylanilyticum]